MAISLEAYNFEILYRSGKKSADADALSQMPTSLCNKVDIPFKETVTCNPYAISLAKVDLHLSVESSVDWSKVQRANPELT